MSSAIAVALSDVLVVPSMDSFQSNLDLSELSNQQLSDLKVCVAQIRLAQQRMGRELLYLTQQLVWMKEILGDRFEQFVQLELNIPRRTLTRYFSIYKLLQAQFSVDGQINLVQASQFTQNALCLLSPNTDDDVMNELRSMADAGTKIDERVVRQIFENHDQDYQAQLAGSQAEAAATKKELERVKEKAELETSRLEKQIRNNDELLRRAAETKAALQDEIATLQKNAIQVTEKQVEVEVPPAGYKSTIEAVNAANKLLSDALAKKAALDDEVEAMNRKSAELKASMAELEGGAEEFIKLKSQIDMVITKYPAARLQAMSSTNKNIKSVMIGIGEAMIEMGRQLSSVAASA